ncbi:MAG: DUF167 family protein [Propionicimonas sp.]
MADATQPGLRADRRQRGLHSRQGRRGPASGVAIRFEIRVKPGAGRTKVGGRYGDAALVVAVQAPAVAGRATAAALAALAEALGCHLRDVSLVLGTTRRTKVVEVPDDLAGRVAELLLA